jgi:hypothetical protein
MPDCWLGFYDVIVAIDHIEKRAFISSCGWPEREESKRLARARERLEETKARMDLGIHLPHLINDKSQASSECVGGGVREPRRKLPIHSGGLYKARPQLH